MYLINILLLFICLCAKRNGQIIFKQMHLYLCVQQPFIAILPKTKHYAKSSIAIQDE